MSIKITDDYNAKLKLWARNKTVYPLPKAVGLPPFTSRKFNSYEEFNTWKTDYLRQIAQSGGVKWTK
jgi:hypothetical protein